MSRLHFLKVFSDAVKRQTSHGKTLINTISQIQPTSDRFTKLMSSTTNVLSSLADPIAKLIRLGALDTGNTIKSIKNLERFQNIKIKISGQLKAAFLFARNAKLQKCAPHFRLQTLAAKPIHDIFKKMRVYAWKLPRLETIRLGLHQTLGSGNSRMRNRHVFKQRIGGMFNSTFISTKNRRLNMSNLKERINTMYNSTYFILNRSVGSRNNRMLNMSNLKERINTMYKSTYFILNQSVRSASNVTSLVDNVSQKTIIEPQTKNLSKFREFSRFISLKDGLTIMQKVALIPALDKLKQLAVFDWRFELLKLGINEIIAARIGRILNMSNFRHTLYRMLNPINLKISLQKAVLEPYTRSVSKVRELARFTYRKGVLYFWRLFCVMLIAYWIRCAIFFASIFAVNILMSTPNNKKG